jgi:serine/threonine protein phosphatase PrpC
MRVADVVARTDTGRKRRRNEDAYVSRPPLFAVADGIGGARAGEVASSLAAAAVKAAREGGSGRERVTALIQEANRRIYERASEDADVAGMGTTMTVALVEDSTVTFGHVGDSRAYILREGSLEQLTDDHSLVAELVRGGKLSPEEAEHHPQRSVITRALGADPDVDVDTFIVETESGDIFLLCSDGLTDMVGDAEIVEVLTRRKSLDDAAKELIKLANKAGGEDNITIVAFELTDEPEERTVEQTRQLPAGGDEEDTLDELDAVPVVEAPEQRRRRRRWPFGLLFLLVPAAIVVWVLVR